MYYHQFISILLFLYYNLYHAFLYSIVETVLYVFYEAILNKISYQLYMTHSEFRIACEQVNRVGSLGVQATNTSWLVRFTMHISHCRHTRYTTGARDLKVPTEVTVPFVS